MPQYDRESFEGRDERPLTFEARRPVRGGRPAPVALILSLLVLVVIAGGVFFLYRGGIRGASDAPEPVGTPIGDVRTPAPAEPQSADPAVGLSIYKDDAAVNAVAPAPTFAPPPEAPAPRPGAATPPAPGASAAAQAAPPAATPPAASVASPPPPLTVASAAAPEKTAAAETAKPAETGGPAAVQIGAFSSASQADAGWNAAAAVAPAAMAGKGKKVETVSRDGATLYRTSITGFATREEAQALCQRLAAAGKNCFVK